MHTQTNPGESEEFARLDGAILGLLVTPYNSDFSSRRTTRARGPKMRSHGRSPYPVMSTTP